MPQKRQTPTLTDSPSVTELAAIAQLIAQRDPALMPVFLYTLCHSTRAGRTCRAREPSDEELARLRALPHGAKLIGSWREGAAWLEGHKQSPGEILDRLLPMPPRPTR